MKSATPLVFACLILSCITCMGQYPIDFSSEANLKAVYDSGLRPWRVNPNTDSLKISDESVRVILPQGRAFSLDIQVGNFNVLSDYRLYKADFIGQSTSLSSAVSKAREICSALGIPPEGLEKAAETFARLGRQSPVPQYWNGRTEVNGIRVDLTLRPSFGLYETRGNVMVGLDFQDPGKPMKFLTEPIKPPPGYEGVSMDPPKPNPNQRPFPPPERSFDAQRRAIDQMKTQRSSSPVPGSTPTDDPVAAKARPATLGIPAETNRQSLWMWVGSLVLAVIVAAWFVLRRKP